MSYTNVLSFVPVAIAIFYPIASSTTQESQYARSAVLSQPTITKKGRSLLSLSKLPPQRRCCPAPRCTPINVITKEHTRKH